MEIIIKAIGKDKSYINELCSEYLKRLKGSVKVEEYELNKNLSEAEVIQREGEILLKNIDLKECIFTLDEKGKHYTSYEFFGVVKSACMNYKKIYFLIGGAFGLSDEVKNRATHLLALSKMTLPHKLARLILVEQIYRAYTIDLNHPYHK